MISNSCNKIHQSCSTDLSQYLHNAKKCGIYGKWGLVKNIQLILCGRVEAHDEASPAPSCTLNPLIICHQIPLDKQTPNATLMYRDKYTLNELVFFIKMIQITCFHFSCTAVNVSQVLTCTRFDK